MNLIYPGAGEEAIDLINKILVFNPYFRVSIDDCLEHVFFKNLRKDDKEIKSNESISFDWENENLDKVRLRELFLEEILYFKSVRESQ